MALTDPRDQWNGVAQAAARSLAPGRLVTTDEVLTEFLQEGFRTLLWWA